MTPLPVLTIPRYDRRATLKRRRIDSPPSSRHCALRYSTVLPSSPSIPKSSTPLRSTIRQRLVNVDCRSWATLKRSISSSPDDACRTSVVSSACRFPRLWSTMRKRLSKEITDSTRSQSSRSVSPRNESTSRYPSWWRTRPKRNHHPDERTDPAPPSLPALSRPLRQNPPDRRKRQSKRSRPRNLPRPSKRVNPKTKERASPLR